MKRAEEFRLVNDFKKRSDMSWSIKTKFPTKVPVLAFPLKEEENFLALSRSKFIVNKNYTMMKFLQTLKKELKSFIHPDAYSSTFLFVERHFVGENGKSKYEYVMPAMFLTVEQTYASYVQPDGLLYVYYGKEKTFG